MRSAASFPVYNPSTQLVEKACMVTCPSCKGEVVPWPDDPCTLCKGDVTVIRNDTSGATRRRGAALDTSIIW